MRLPSKQILFVFLLLPFLMRFWGVGDELSHRGDEGIHVPTAKNYVERGHLVPQNWYHPPLSHLTLHGSVKLAGDNPYGWRMRNVVFGALSVLLFFMLAGELFNDFRKAWLAGLLLSLDPLHILISRSTFGEIVALCFVIVSILAFKRYMEGRRGFLLIAGGCLGLAVATKWYYAPVLAALFMYSLYLEIGKNGFKPWKVLHLLFVFVVLPISLYLLTFYAWFGRGYGLTEFMQMQLDAYRGLQALKIEEFDHAQALAASSSPWEWFAKPIFIGFGGGVGEWRRLVMFMNNPPVWLLTFPAIAFVAYRWWKERDRGLLLLLLLFIASYGQFVIVERPTFLYSALVCLPFALLAVAHMTVSMFDRMKIAPVYFRMLLVLLTLWGIYLYPLVTGISVPASLYTSVIAFAKIFNPIL